MIENLNQLKRALRPGIRLQIVDHRRTECINQLREVTWITSNGFCTKVLNQPADKIDAGNNGRGAMLWWGRPAPGHLKMVCAVRSPTAATEKKR